MSWIKLDTQFFAHPKVIGLSKDAKLLYLTGLTYCGAFELEGVLPHTALKSLAAGLSIDFPTSASELVLADLWRPIDQGFAIYDWLNCDFCADPDLADRNSSEYRHWRGAVRARDNYACQHCGATRCELDAHHIQPWALYPAERFNVANGLTLCESCHKAEHRGNREAGVLQ